ncbi:TrbI F-type domain-containing protein [uncultured Shewanella sp.]|uniref:TrbI F-type domain-containing protein n=1 Tax=uncultured Shewanella sp. TaxID=173975 RepID=UPI0026254F19|nr:TrbI F-type domain-containing protein [uncultured Shewanella sp.]
MKKQIQLIHQQKVLWGCLFLLSILSLYLLLNQPKTLVQFDLKGTISTFESDIAKRQLTIEQQNVIIKRFTQQLDITLDSYSDEHNLVILVSPAVITGLDDVTASIQEALFIALSNKDA